MRNQNTSAPGDIYRRFWRGRATKLSVIFLATLIVMAVVTLPWTTSWMNAQQLDEAVRHAPSVTPVLSSKTVFANAKPSFTATALFRASSWLGHDDLGRSLLFRLLPGFLISVAFGLAAAAIATAVGVSMGATAALAGGMIDRTIMRIVDLLFSLPYVLTVILLKVALTRPLTNLLGGESQLANLLILLLAVCGVSWLTMARVVRGQVLSLRDQPFMEAARAAGAGPLRMLTRHILPNLAGPITVYAALVVPQAIMQEAFLSFLGIGVSPPTPSLGRLASDGVEAVNTFVAYWWLIVFPAGLLACTVVALNYIGDGLRATIDPD